MLLITRLAHCLTVASDDEFWRVEGCESGNLTIARLVLAVLRAITRLVLLRASNAERSHITDVRCSCVILKINAG